MLVLRERRVGTLSISTWISGSCRSAAMPRNARLPRFPICAVLCKERLRDAALLTWVAVWASVRSR